MRRDIALSGSIRVTGNPYYELRLTFQATGKRVAQESEDLLFLRGTDSINSIVQDMHKNVIQFKDAWTLCGRDGFPLLAPELIIKLKPLQLFKRFYSNHSEEYQTSGCESLIFRGLGSGHRAVVWRFAA
jgi:hypothetical protein